MAIDSMLPARLHEHWNLENAENFGGRRLTNAQLMKCTLSLRLKLWSKEVCTEWLWFYSC